MMANNKAKSQVQLPSCWDYPEMGDLVTIKYGKGLSKKKLEESGFPVFGANGIIGFYNNYLYKEPQVLISCRGAYSGKINWSPPECFVTNNSLILEVPSGQESLSRYLFYALQSIDKSKLITGTAQPQVTITNAQKLRIPLAPIEQRDDIIAEIEKQFSRLDEAVTSLKRAKANLKHYKAAVLKAAVEGKLTEEWRKQHPDVEPATELLKRILGERRRKWEEAELAIFRAKGKEPNNDNWKKKYKEPSQVDTENLPNIPAGWAWANFEQLAAQEPNALKAGPFGSSLKKSFYVTQGYKIYGQEQVIRNDPHYGDYYIDENRYMNLKACAVKPGDILISLVGTIGKILILPDGIEPGIINPRLVKLSLDNRLINSNYIKAYLQSPYVRYLFSLASHGGTMDILNLTILKKLPIPVPPISEQLFLLGEIERISSLVVAIYNNDEANMRRASRLRQSILENAFSGRLFQKDNTI